MLLIEQMSIFERENLSAINRMKILLEQNRSFYLFIHDKTSYNYAMKLLSTKNVVWGASGWPLTHLSRTFEWYQQCDESILGVVFNRYAEPKYKVWVTSQITVEYLEQIHLG